MPHKKVAAACTLRENANAATYIIVICIKYMVIPKIWITPKGGLRQMQSFWFSPQAGFALVTKRTGGWGLVPENNSNIKTNFDKLKNFQYISKV